MSKKVAFQMDPLGSLNYEGDSSYLLALEAKKRGYDTYSYTPEDLHFIDQDLKSHSTHVNFLEQPPYYEILSTKTLNLKDLDVIWMRQDPPFDMSYLTATYLLETLHPKPLIVNNPKEVRNAPEKLLVLKFPDFIPKTLITKNSDDIHAFQRDVKDIIIKPLYANAGKGVFFLKNHDKNLESIIELLLSQSKEPLIIQEFLSEVYQGDKRVTLVDGEFKAAFNRIPAKDDFRANLRTGGSIEKCDLTIEEQKICDALKPYLKEHGLIYTAIDIIGGKLTEINVTSPTGLKQHFLLEGKKLEEDIWNAIEEKI